MDNRPAVRENERCLGDAMNPERLTRREFVRLGAASAAALAGGARLAAAPPARPIGLQLYSVRELLPQDFAGTLRQVHAAGYAVVEAAGYHGRSAAGFRQAMDQAGLRCVSSHHPFSALESQLDTWIEYGHTLGIEYIVCSSAGGLHRDPDAKGPQTLNDWRWIADEYNRIGEQVKAAGLLFGVHNHMPEFATLDGVLVYDVLLRRTDPDLVVFEMDCGWVYASGHDPVHALSQSPDRFPLLHIKDVIREPDGTVRLPALGKGTMDYAAILRAATGLRYAFIEQEQFDMDPMEELRQDAAYLRALLR